MKNVTKLFSIFILIAFGGILFAQSVAINNDGSSADASAILDVKSTNKGFLPPRIALTGTTDASTISSPVAGLLIYNTSNTNDVTPGYYYYGGSSWVKVDAGLWSFDLEEDISTTYNVGIGTTSPQNKLVVGGSGWAQFISNTHDHNPSTSYNYGVYIGSNRSGGATEGNIAYHDYLTFAEWDGTTYSERMRIDGNGNVGIGTTTPRYKLEVGPETEYDISSEYVNTYMRFNVSTPAGSAPESATDGNGSHDASIFAQGSIMTGQHFKAISDERVKKDITGISNSIETLQQLHPVTYKMKDQVIYDQKIHYGFIAQEVEKVLPEAVNTGSGDIPVLKPYDEVNFEDGVEYTLIVKNGNDTKELTYTASEPRPNGEILVKSRSVNDFKSLTYDMIFTLAVDAIQEQQKIIDAQQKTLDQQQLLLEAQQKAFDDQQQQIDKLEKLIKKKFKK